MNLFQNENARNSLANFASWGEFKNLFLKEGAKVIWPHINDNHKNCPVCFETGAARLRAEPVSKHWGNTPPWRRRIFYVTRWPHIMKANTSVSFQGKKEKAVWDGKFLRFCENILKKMESISFFIFDCFWWFQTIFAHYLMISNDFLFHLLFFWRIEIIPYFIYCFFDAFIHNNNHSTNNFLYTKQKSFCKN